MGSPPLGLPARVDRRRQNQVTGVRARTDRRSLETMDLNALGSRQTHRGHVTGSSGVEPRMMVRVVSVLRGAHSRCQTCSPEHENAATGNRHAWATKVSLTTRYNARPTRYAT